MEEEGRGRGRTRDRKRTEDVVVKRNLVEDALRSSIATLISLSGPRQTMSPAVSSVTLSALVNPHQPIPGSISPHRSSYESSRQVHARPRPPPRSFTAVASATFFFEDDEDEFEAQQAFTQEETSQWEDAVHKSSTSETDDGAAVDVSDDEGTQLGPRGLAAGGHPSQAMDMSAFSRTARERERSLSDSLSSRPSIYSPIQSRSMGTSLPTASSSWGRRSTRRPRRPSVSPGPASLEERRRARAGRTGRVAQQVASLTDDDNEAFELEHTFFELVDAASMFMSMSPRHASGSVVGGTISSSATARLGVASPRPSGMTSPRPLTQSRSIWTPEATASPASVPSSDPFLASSVPTLDLSSGTDEARSPATKGEMTGKPAASGDRSGQGKADTGGGGGGWFGWLADLKLWHLVSIAGILVGVGLNAG